MRFGAGYSVCSGTMRDAETVLTAGHCVNNGSGGAWADEIWVYPGWDGNGTINPGPAVRAEPYGWAHATYFGSWTGWTVDGDFNYDVGVIGVTRAVGTLTGWFGWSYGGDCTFWTNQFVQNASYPAEGCGLAGLHNGRDMYFWTGFFDSCPSFNRLQLDTSGGCFNAIWGGMSGSGVYYVDGDDRFVHGITSTSDRATFGRYARQFQEWVEWTDNTFIPTVRGAAFDLQALDVNAGPSVIPVGGSTTLLNHLAANATNGAASNTWTFRVYLSTNDNISTSDTLLSVQSYPWDFAAMGSVRVNMAMVTIPPGTTPGNYFIGVIYDDATDGVIDNNDTDDWDAVPVTITAADLDVTALTAPAFAAPGDGVNVANTVQNIGNVAAGAFRVGLYLSTDTTCTTADTFLASRNVAGLGNGASSPANTPVTIPPGTPLGAHYLCAIADDLLQQAESNEGNNTGFQAIDIRSATPAITLKVNGQDLPLVNTNGPYHLTLNVAPSTWTTSLDWYWAILVNGQLFWVTSGGISATPAPLLSAPPVALTNTTLLNVNLGPGTTVTSIFLFLDGASIVAVDWITAAVPPS
jgi:hypothetical protein